jgi:hypothetical protein
VDVNKAFDSICHFRFVDAAVKHGVHPSLVAAILRELAGGDPTVSVQGFEGKPKIMGGGRQGGRDTPCIWNFVLWAALQGLVASWDDRSLVWCLDSDARTSNCKLNVQVWADDLVVYASTRADLELKLAELAHALAAAGLHIKPGSPQWTANAQEHFDFKGDFTIGDTGLPCVFQKNGMSILGVWLDPECRTSNTISHRMKAACVHWHGRKSQLCCRRAPLRKRIDRWMATVSRTLLWGCGAWACTIQELVHLDSFQLRCLRAMWNRREKAGSKPGEHIRKLTAHIRARLREWGVPLVSELALRFYHSWAGHCARFPAADPLFHLLRRPAGIRGRRAFSGRPRDWETRLKEVHGGDWLSQTADRKFWSSMCWSFVQQRNWERDRPLLSPTQMEAIMAAHLYRARFFSMLSPRCTKASFAGLKIGFVGRRDAWDLSAGRVSCNSSRKSLCRKLQQAMFLLSHAAHVDLDGNTFIEDKSEHAMCRQLAGAAARTGQASCSIEARRPADTTSLLAYWGGHIEEGVGGGCACAVVLVSSGGDVSLHSWVAKPISNTDLHECEMLSLLGALEMLLNGIGVSACGPNDPGDRFRRECM